MSFEKIIEDNVIKYRHNLKEKQEASKIFKVCMSTEAKKDLTKDIKKGMEVVNKITNEINSWSEDKIENEFNKRGLAEEKEKRKKSLVLPKMENIVEGKVITAYPPEPSKFPHIGHAYACLINYLFAKQHNGKFIIRFEDTNPDLAKEEYYLAQLQGYEWLGIKPDQVIYASDYMDLIYSKVDKLFEMRKAYVCTCDSETTRKNRELKQECKCRSNSVDHNMKMWNKMKSGELKKGEASIRLAIDMKSPQGEMRDPVVMRVNENLHARQGIKYKVWPSYILQNTVLDCETGVTHRFRSKEFEPLKPVQKLIAKWLGYSFPQIFEFARVNLVGGQASGRKLREQVESGGLSWDHPALTTLASLKRRGFLPESIKEFVDKMGVSKTESTIEWTVLESINRKMLAKIDVSKISAFNKPVKVSINDKNEYLKENLTEGYIDSELELNKEFRVKHFGNIIRTKEKEIEVIGNETKPGLIIASFSKEVTEIKMLMPDFDEPEKVIFIDSDEFTNLKDNDIVQLQGIGFCRLENKKEKVFVYGHT